MNARTTLDKLLREKTATRFLLELSGTPAVRSWVAASGRLESRS